MECKINAQINPVIVNIETTQNINLSIIIDAVLEYYEISGLMYDDNMLFRINNQNETFYLEDLLTKYGTIEDRRRIIQFLQQNKKNIDAIIVNFRKI